MFRSTGTNNSANGRILKSETYLDVIQYKCSKNENKVSDVLARELFVQDGRTYFFFTLRRNALLFFLRLRVIDLNVCGIMFVNNKFVSVLVYHKIIHWCGEYIPLQV